MKNTTAIVLGAALGLLAAANAGAQDAASYDTPAFRSIIQNDFQDLGQATTARLVQTPEQAACSAADYAGKPLPADLEKSLNTAAYNAVVYPADGKFLGDWKAGLKIASNGKGMQSNDPVDQPNGGNCLACHKLVPNDPSQGNLGPELVGYEKLRGNSDAVVKYTWARIYNSVAFNACSFMPPFGAHQILTEQQMKDVMALLLDPNSPVNK
jgi:sulfur-oxidizing protein SoxX